MLTGGAVHMYILCIYEPIKSRARVKVEFVTHAERALQYTARLRTEKILGNERERERELRSAEHLALKRLGKCICLGCKLLPSLEKRVVLASVYIYTHHIILS